MRSFAFAIVHSLITNQSQNNHLGKKEKKKMGKDFYDVTKFIVGKKLSSDSKMERS